MKLAPVAASVGIIALVVSAFVGATPASAAPTLFPNPNSTPQLDDLDIGVVAVDFTADALKVSASVDNFVPSADYTYSVYVLPSQRSVAEEGNRLEYTAVKSGISAPVVYGQSFYNGVGNGQNVIPGASVETTENVITLTYAAEGFANTTTFFIWVSLSNNGAAATGGIPSPGGTLGFGPINVGTVITEAYLRVSSPAQVYGSTPAVAFAGVSSKYARGDINVMSGSKVVATGYYTGTELALNLDTKLAYGKHQLRAVFVPSAAQLYTTSTSTAVPFDVLSPGTKTSTKLTLSKSTQRIKKKAAKLSVKVSHKPAGKVVIYDGKKKLKTLTLKKGRASYTLSSKLSKGKHVLKAVFVPKNPLTYAPSTSKTKTLTVKK